MRWRIPWGAGLRAYESDLTGGEVAGAWGTDKAALTVLESFRRRAPERELEDARVGNASGGGWDVRSNGKIVGLV